MSFCKLMSCYAAHCYTVAILIVVFDLLHDLLSSPISHRCVWSGITGHNLTPEKRDNNYTPHSLTPHRASAHSSTYNLHLYVLLCICNVHFNSIQYYHCYGWLFPPCPSGHLPRFIFSWFCVPVYNVVFTARAASPRRSPLPVVSRCSTQKRHVIT